MDVILRVLSEDNRVIAYRPELADALGDPLAAILLQQMIAYASAKNWQAFYKFREPCGHKMYVAGDSWTERLAWSPIRFDATLKVIGTKIKRGVSKDAVLATAFPQRRTGETDAGLLERLRQALKALVLYWTDASRVTWYQVNVPLLAIFVNRTYLGNCESARYLESAALADSMKVLSAKKQSLRKSQLHESESPERQHREQQEDLPAEPAPLSRSSLKTALEDARQLTLSPSKPKLLWEFPFLRRVLWLVRRDLHRAERAREQAAVEAAAAYYNAEASAEQIVAMIDAWYQWVPCRPTTRGVIVPSDRHFGNKNNREYAANLWSRGVRPADIIRCLDNIRMAEAGSYLARFQTEPMTFQFACEKFVERWTAETREAHTYTPEAPRVTPKRPDTVIDLGDLDGRDLLDVYAEHDELIVDVPPAYVSPQEAANPTPKRDPWEEWGELPDEPATPEEIARFEALGVL